MLFFWAFTKTTPEQDNSGPPAYLSRDAVPVNIIWSILNGGEPSSSFRDHRSPWNPYSGPHSKTQCLFVVIEMSELSTDKHPAGFKPLSLFCGMALCVCFTVWKRVGTCVSLKKKEKKKDKCKMSLPLLSLCQPLMMMQSKDRQYFTGLKLSAGLPVSSNGWWCLCDFCASEKKQSKSSGDQKGFKFLRLSMADSIVNSLSSFFPHLVLQQLQVQRDLTFSNLFFLKTVYSPESQNVYYILISFLTTITTTYTTTTTKK